MKFTWKMISVVALLLALALSVSGYLVVRGAFRSSLDSEMEDAKEDMRMFGLTVQALCAGELRFGDADGAVQSMRTLLTQDGSAQQREFCIRDESGAILVRTNGMRISDETETPNGVIQVRIVSDGDRHYVLCTQNVSCFGSTYRLSRIREITPLFTRADDDLSRYQLIMLLILIVGIGITTALTFYLTRPVRRISRAAKQFSEGQYDKRAVVRSNDELGQLAQSFNDMADSLETKIHELADAAQRQKDFTASFAHELKTPLTSVIGYADTLRSRVLPQKKQVEAANYIFSEGKRLEAMSFALLDLFALERETPKFRKVSTSRLVQDTAASCAYILKEKNIRLETRVEEQELSVVPELLQVLLYNLIDNARKASAEGGIIRLYARQTEGGFRFSVRDNGRGIPKEALERLTEPFYMVDKSRARAEGGAGLGLALCSRIAELHGTSLAFESEVGKGTCVSFVLGGAEA